MERDFEVRLTKVQRQLTRWRADHAAPTPIPSKIWDSAVELSSILGLSLVARELRLDYSSLRKRVQKSNQAPTFVEVLRPNVPSNSLGRCVLKCDSAEGKRLTLQLNNPGPSELATLLREWSN